MASTVTVDTPDGGMAVYDAEPQGPPAGGVVVIQEAFGVTDHIEDVTRRLAGQGYRAVAPHLFHRSGDPRLGYDDISAVMPHMRKLTAEGISADLEATFGYLEKAGFGAERVGIVGFCMGGTVAFFAAVSRPLGAAVTFYGGGIAAGRFGYPAQTEVAATLQAPWLGLYGDLDKGIPVDEVEALRAAAAEAKVATQVVRYPGADHGFHCDARPSFHPPSAEDAWRRTLDWFGRHLAQP
jgi:carboxymethylenebutenolidase